MPYKLIDAGKRQWTVAPRAIGQDYRTRTPPQEILEGQVSSQLRPRDKVDAGMSQLTVDFVHLLPALFLVPPGKPVLDLSIRAIVLLQHDADHILLCKLGRSLSSGDSSTDNNH
jgi:hypothetical protein